MVAVVACCETGSHAVVVAILGRVAAVLAGVCVAAAALARAVVGVISVGVGFGESEVVRYGGDQRCEGVRPEAAHSAHRRVEASVVLHHAVDVLYLEPSRVGLLPGLGAPRGRLPQVELVDGDRGQSPAALVGVVVDLDERR